MQTTLRPENLMEKAIFEALTEQIGTVKEETIKAAVKQFEDALRKKIGEVTINLSQYFSVEHGQNGLVITIFKERKE